jgi:uncharacterized protein (DUF2062 family)
MISFRRYYRWLRYIPRKKHLKGSWIHRVLGERIFIRELWRPSRQTVALGVALGLFIGLSPTFGVQIFLSCVLAYLFRVNLPFALLGTLITNPFTAAPIYTFELKLGLWLAGRPEATEYMGYTDILKHVAVYARPLWVGSIVAGSVAALVGWILASVIWALISRFWHDVLGK